MINVTNSAKSTEFIRVTEHNPGKLIAKPTVNEVHTIEGLG